MPQKKKQKISKKSYPKTLKVILIVIGLVGLVLLAPYIYLLYVQSVFNTEKSAHEQKTERYTRIIDAIGVPNESYKTSFTESNNYRKNATYVTRSYVNTESTIFSSIENEMQKNLRNAGFEDVESFDEKNKFGNTRKGLEAYCKEMRVNIAIEPDNSREVSITVYTYNSADKPECPKVDSN